RPEHIAGCNLICAVASESRLVRILDAIAEALTPIWIGLIEVGINHWRLDQPGGSAMGVTIGQHRGNRVGELGCCLMKWNDTPIRWENKGNQGFPWCRAPK